MSDHPKAIKTNGEGQVTTSHLNLTRSLADVWAAEAKRGKVYPRYFKNRFTAKSHR